MGHMPGRPRTYAWELWGLPFASDVTEAGCSGMQGRGEWRPARVSTAIQIPCGDASQEGGGTPAERSWVLGVTEGCWGTRGMHKPYCLLSRSVVPAAQLSPLEDYTV
jgi:hypothetical protein